MLYTTQGQFLLFVTFFIFGAISLTLFKIKNKILKTKNKHAYIYHIVDFIYCFIICVIFIILNNKLNYGEFRLFILIAFVLGLIFCFYFNNFIESKIRIRKK